ncbi:MAG: head decoration protein [bacterium]|nr:head decoration protein [bacterium]
MNTTGRTSEGSCTQELLVLNNGHATDICHVTIASGQGKLTRGTILNLNLTNNKCVIGGSAVGTAAYILAEDVDATSADQIAEAYRSGDFARNALTVKVSTTLSMTDEENLRSKGIYLDSVMK